MRLHVAAVAVLFALGCGPKAAPIQHPAPPAGDEDPTCPLLVAGTSISAEDTETGAALVFVTTGDVAAVRARATALVAAHNARAVDGDHLAESCHGCMADTVETPSKATLAEVPGGAKVTFTTANADLGFMQQGALRMHAGHLAHGGSCKMAM